MGWLIILLICIAVLYIEYNRPNREQQKKPQQQPSKPPVQTQPRQERCTDTHDIRYWRELAEHENQPQYKVDWLEESLERNPDNRDWNDFRYYAFESFKKNLPYICETEDEWDKLHDRFESPLQGSVEGMMRMVQFYSYGETYDPHKQEYWKDKVLSLAQKGDKNAQAVLCSSWTARIMPEDAETHRKCYMDKLWKEANSGDGYSQLAIGEYLCEVDTDKISWLEKAASHGLTDAYYSLAHAYPTNLENYHQKRIECYQQGAECNNGFHTIHCMNGVGRAYLDGEFIPRDLAKAEYWLRKAAEIDPEFVKSNLKWLEIVKREENC